MKLLHRTTLDFLSATIVVLAITGTGLYLYLQKSVTDEMNEQLYFQASLLEEQLRSGETSANPFMLVKEVSPTAALAEKTGDTLLYDRVQKVKEDYHYLQLVKDIGGHRYFIQVMTTYVGWSHYYQTIFTGLFVAILLLAASGVLISYFGNRRIWKPFFLNLEQLKEHSVSSPQPIRWLDSPITEFAELKKALQDLTERSHREYMALREFTENASHEIQTPLGIIQSKLDRMSQLEVSEEMAGYIVQAKSGVERLSKMNKNLLLLAKLDNEAFDTPTDLRFDVIVNDHLAMMQDLFAARSVRIGVVTTIVNVLSDPYLAEVLVSNLFSNALRYTPPEGEVAITLSPQALTISNSGEPLDFPAEQLFERFKKSTRHIQSTGLGLSIVQQICYLNKWTIRYSYEQGYHVFRVGF